MTKTSITYKKYVCVILFAYNYLYKISFSYLIYKKNEQNILVKIIHRIIFNHIINKMISLHV